MNPLVLDKGRKPEIRKHVVYVHSCFFGTFIGKQPPRFLVRDAKKHRKRGDSASIRVFLRDPSHRRFRTIHAGRFSLVFLWLEPPFYPETQIGRPDTFSRYSSSAALASDNNTCALPDGDSDTPDSLKFIRKPMSAASADNRAYRA